jgi:hypothetical protein
LVHFPNRWFLLPGIVDCLFSGGNRCCRWKWWWSSLLWPNLGDSQHTCPVVFFSSMFWFFWPVPRWNCIIPCLHVSSTSILYLLLEIYVIFVVHPSCTYIDGYINLSFSRLDGTVRIVYYHGEAATLGPHHGRFLPKSL